MSAAVVRWTIELEISILPELYNVLSLSTLLFIFNFHGGGFYITFGYRVKIVERETKRRRK